MVNLVTQRKLVKTPLGGPAPPLRNPGKDCAPVRLTQYECGGCCRLVCAMMVVLGAQSRRTWAHSGHSSPTQGFCEAGETVLPRGKRLPRVLFTFFRGDRKAAAKVGWFVGHPDIRGWVVGGSHWLLEVQEI